MLRVVCPKQHHTSKRDPNEWRHFRGCGVCGEVTVVDYQTSCSHQDWRYPNALPVDGDLCPSCGKEYVEPIRGKSAHELEELRGVCQLLSVLLEEAEGYYERRDATEEIRDICSAHGFTYLKGKK